MTFLPFLFLILLVSLSLANPLVRAPGQNGETCITDADCVGSRICLALSSRLPCNIGGPEVCICVPPSTNSICGSSAECDEGELCVLGVATVPLLSSFCISDRLVIPEFGLVEYEESLVLSGGSLASCRTDLQCGGEGSRCLLAPFGVGVECSLLFPNCACVPDGGLVSCTGSADCPNEEVCVELTGIDADLIEGTVCADRSVLRVADFQMIDAEEGETEEIESLGLTFDSCLSNEDCVEPRICIGPLGACEGNVGDKCACIPNDTTLTYCGNDGDCLENEVCAQGSPAEGRNITGNCVSSAFLANEDNVEPYDGPGTGVTLETCLTNGACFGDLECSSLSGGACEIPPCSCATPTGTGIAPCRTSTDCLERELCLKNSDAPFDPGCITEVLLINPEFVELVDDRQTLEACTNDGECAGIRRCNTFDFNSPCLPTTPNCVCKPRDGELRDCDIGVGCPGREVCAIGGTGDLTLADPKCVDRSALERFGLDLLEESGPMMTASPEEEDDDGEFLPPDPSPMAPEPSESPEMLPFDPETDLPPPSPEVSPDTAAAATPTPSPSPVPFVCVDAELLDEFSMEELVFEEHAHGSVLCDKHGSCATDGHMVTWNGSGMMMRSYCDMIENGCERRTMKVNSPRYKKGLRVSSRTEGLEFTAFAAKYATRVEEIGLNALVRVGM